MTISSTGSRKLCRNGRYKFAQTVMSSEGSNTGAEVTGFLILQMRSMNIKMER
jgi:hypothetical protein